MELVFIIAALGIGLLVAELLAPTGGGLAVAGAIGLAVAGVIAFQTEGENSTLIGAALVTAGVLSLITSIVIGKKVLSAHTENPVRTGHEEMVGREAEVRVALDPVGQVFADGALWRAKSADDAEIAPGNRVRVESVDGLTLIVRPPDK